MPLQPARFRPIMHALKCLGLLSALLVLMSPVCLAQAKNSSVVAVVNADPITRQALADATLSRYGKDVVDSHVNLHLILQECKKRGVTISDEQVNQEVMRLTSKFGLNVESYLKLLQDERDISPNQYSREIIWPMLALRALVADQVEPTREEFDRAFMGQFGEAIKCRLIMVPSKETAESLQAKAVADPSSFETLAKKYSKDESSASVGGLIPPIRRFNGDTNLENAAFALKDNEVSPVLQLGDQWVVLQAVSRIPASIPSPKNLPNIQEQIRDRIRDQKMRGASGHLFKKLQKEANVVKVLGDATLEKQHPGVAAIVNGQPVTIASITTECLKRHGSEVLDGEINRKLLAQALRKANRKVTQEDIRAEVERAAKSYGYINGDGSANLKDWLDSVTSDGKTTQQIYIDDSVWPSVALKKLVEDTITISDEDIQKGFQSFYGPRVEILAIVLPNQRAAQKVWEMARDNPTEKFFGQLAQQYSIEPVSASNSGKVPPIRKYGGQPAIEREVFGLKAGELSGIVATGDKYIVMRCLGQTDPVVQEIAAVKSELVRDLREKKMAIAMASEFDKLKEDAEIDNFVAASKEIAKIATAPEAAPQRR